jgi:N-methylhydantoinase A
VDVAVSALRGPDDIADLARRFHDAHHRRYGHKAQAEAIEIVNFEVTAVGLIPKPPLRTFAVGSSELPAPAAVRPVHFGPMEAAPIAVFRRSDLRPGALIEGPAVIEEATSTIVLYRGQTARVDPHLNIEVDL